VSVLHRPNFEAELSRSGAMSLIALKGELDREADPRLRQAIDAALAFDPLIAGLDLRELACIDSNGIYGLIQIGRAYEARALNRRAGLLKSAR
jgi:ABC-type transporter Mla MlaB component